MWKSPAKKVDRCLRTYLMRAQKVNLKCEEGTPRALVPIGFIGLGANYELIARAQEFAGKTFLKWFGGYGPLQCRLQWVHFSVQVLHP